MIGRETQNANNLFFLCSLIEYIGRKTKNHRNVVVNAIGKKDLQHIFDFADVYHSENIDKLVFEFTKKHHIENGIFDNISNAKYSIPTHWDIGKVYKRLIISVNKKDKKPLIDTVSEVYNSWLSRKIEDFNSSVYYENPEYLFQCYWFGDFVETNEFSHK
ncbi:MAG: hypothetical protein LBE36_03835 [Flavobacteriaceae bacterium]|jgi:hypothetical protein|nr:hypothetical protein [Flavobacteriaceae bacterium]